jgi:hypothetical protein
MSLRQTSKANPFSGVPGSARSESLLWAPLLAISAAAFSIEGPFFFFGTPSGHDVEFHLYSWLEVLAQWRQGIFFPRWASLAHFAYGEPRFVFYPPASWTLGALLSAVFPWPVAASIYIWVVLVLAGASMFVLARRWLERRDAIFAAVLYVANPYHLVIVYWRSAFAELLASCLVPLLLLLVVRAVEEGWRVMVPLALLLAAAWLTNAPAAVMIHYSLVLLVVVLSWQHRSPRLLLVAAAAVALGACLSAFYLFPAIYEQRWVNIGEAVSAGSRPQDNFLFIHTTDVDHDAFNRIISWVAMLEMVVLVAATVGAWRNKSWRDRNRKVWNSVVGWVVACSAMMFSVTWLLCLSMILSIFVALGLRRWWMRGAICVMTVVVIAVAWHHVQTPWWDNVGDLREMEDNVATGAGYEGTDEYTPVGADPAAIDKDARKVTVEGPARAAMRVLESKSFSAEMSAPDQLALRLFRYPAWQVEVNGRVVETASRAGTGQMLVPVEAGANRVQITLVRTWDRTVGGWGSLLSALCLVVWSVAVRSSRNHAVV